MTETEAKETILANGYKIVSERLKLVTVSEPSRSSGIKSWTGVNFLDLAQTFKLHERQANRRKS